MCKMLTVQIREEIYSLLISCGLFPEEQKWYSEGTRGSVELRYIDQHVLNKSKARRKMAWIDYKKASGMLLQRWVIHCSKMYKETWRVELRAGWKSFTVIKIQREIFQRDALLLLLLVIAMMPFNHIVRKCIGGYKLTKSKKKTNHLTEMDEIKFFAKKNVKELKALIQIVLSGWNFA